MRFFDTHAVKSIAFISAAALLLAWPPALPWIAAIVMLQIGVKHLKLAFKEADRAVRARVEAHAAGPSLPEPRDGERQLAGAGRDILRVGS